MMKEAIAGFSARQQGKGEENPYLAARRTWNSNRGAVVSAMHVLAVVAVLAVAAALVAVGGMILNNRQSKLVPYLVFADSLGQVYPQGVVSATPKNDARLLRAAVADFITQARMVTPDQTLQRHAILRVYAFLSKGDPALQKMSEHFQSDVSSPFSRAEREMVEISIKSILQQSPETWLVDWLERSRDRQGNLLGEVNMRGTITAYQTDSTHDVAEEDMQANPLRIFVRDFSWTRVL